MAFVFMAASYELTSVLFLCLIPLLFVANKFFFLSSSSNSQ